MYNIASLAFKLEEDHVNSNQHNRKAAIFNHCAGVTYGAGGSVCQKRYSELLLAQIPGQTLVAKVASPEASEISLELAR